ncbi:hypothetical protein ACFXAW_31440 [Streptomyces sp. NPDC059445]|uniref:hypothetical protein n=1 Tax=unclassified Streptomyces TaxID=2593676 RepID=UPI0036B15D35
MVDTYFGQEADRRPAGLSMPLQAPPVYRSAVGAAGAASAAGVQADGIGSWLGGLVDDWSHAIPGSGPVGDVLGWLGL